MQLHPLDPLFALSSATAEVATILEARGRHWLVRRHASGAPQLALRAASCLLEPRVGDTAWVLCADPKAYVVAILERRVQDAESVLAVPGDLAIRAGGAARVEATTELTWQSADLHVEARRGRFLLGTIELCARSARAYVRESTFLGKVMATLVDRITQHCQTSHRAVDQLDHVHAGALEYRATGTARLQGRNTLMSASDLAKVDAAQIHVG